MSILSLLPRFLRAIAQRSSVIIEAYIMLNNTVLALSLQFLSVKDHCQVGLVCKQFNITTNNSPLWRGLFPVWYKATLDWRTEYLSYFRPTTKIWELIKEKSHNDLIVEITTDFVQLLSTYDYIVPILKVSLTHHIHEHTSVESLFRFNTTTTKLSAFYFRICGHEYLKQTLLPLILQTKEGSAECEIDPFKIIIGEDPAVNEKKLAIMVTRFATAIFNSCNSIPSDIRNVIAHAHAEQNKRFSERPYESAIGLFFSRFILPIICEMAGKSRVMQLICLALRPLFGGYAIPSVYRFLQGMNEVNAALKDEKDHFLAKLVIPPLESSKSSEIRSKQLPFMLSQFLKHTNTKLKLKENKK